MALKMVRVNGGIEKGQWRRWSGSMGVLNNGRSMGVLKGMNGGRVNGGIEKGQWGHWSGNGGIEKGQWRHWSGSMRVLDNGGIARSMVALKRVNGGIG